MKKQIMLAALLFAGFVAIAVAMIMTGPTPGRRPVVETIRSASAIVARECVIQPRVVGYGEAEPDKSWTAFAQISGRIVWMSDKLENGEFVAKNEELLRIDEREYALAVGSSQANIKKIEAAIKEKETAKTNLERRRDLLQKVLALSEKNLDRQKALFSSKTISSSTLEQEEINVLQQRNALANLESELNLVPAQLSSLTADLNVAKIALEQAELNLSYTKIRAPFAGRISTITAEIEQYAAKGNSLFKVDSIARTEIMTSLAVESLSILADSGRERLNRKIPLPNVGIQEKKLTAEAPADRSKMKINVSAVGGGDFIWNGEFLRFGAEIDPDTRMISLIVAVDEPYQRHSDKAHIPLNKGLFCRVEFFGSPRPALVVPRNALHGDRLYVASADGVLEMRQVAVKFVIDSFAIIEKGLQAGETVVTSDIVPAVNGMKIKTIVDDRFYETVKKELAPAIDDGRMPPVSAMPKVQEGK